MEKKNMISKIKNHKLCCIVIILVLLGGGGFRIYKFFFQKKQPQKTVQTQKATTGTIEKTVEGSGSVKATTQNVTFSSDFIKKVIGQKTDVIASGFSGSFVIMACHNEKELFNKIMLVNPPSLTQLKQMPNRKDRLLKTVLEIPIFGTLIYHMIVSRDNVNNLFIEKMYYNPFHVDTQMTDAYYEAAHRGGCYTRFLYSSLASKYMNINISKPYIGKSGCHNSDHCNNAVHLSSILPTAAPHGNDPQNNSNDSYGKHHNLKAIEIIACQFQSI